MVKVLPARIFRRICVKLKLQLFLDQLHIINVEFGLVVPIIKNYKKVKKSADTLFIELTMFCLFSVRVYNEQCEYKQKGIK